MPFGHPTRQWGVADEVDYFRFDCLVCLVALFEKKSPTG